MIRKYLKNKRLYDKYKVNYIIIESIENYIYH